MTNAAPVFTGDNQVDFAISETEAVGHIVSVLKTDDADFDVPCMHVVSGDDAHFTVYEGALRIARKLDHETRNKYKITLVVTDGIDYDYLNVSDANFACLMHLSLAAVHLF